MQLIVDTYYRPNADFSLRESLQAARFDDLHIEPAVSRREGGRDVADVARTQRASDQDGHDI